MDASAEVQRLLQLVRARIRRSSTLRRRQLSYQHFVSDSTVISKLSKCLTCKFPLFRKKEAGIIKHEKPSLLKS